jgi:prepilin-type N-terminal cleavage/methylation domain-containing protein
MSRAGPASARGFTLVEVTMACAVLAIGIVGVLAAVAASDAQDEAARARSIAIDAARLEAERIAAVPFRLVFSSFDDTPLDDPGGPGTAPGPWFAVAGLSPIAGDYQVGKVLFPTMVGSPATLREDSSDASIWQLRFPPSDARSALLGMPRDLNGDGAIDSNGKETIYTLLPCLITLRWRTSAGGEDSFALRLLLADRTGGS